jgi:hypothetical protein
MQGAQKLRSEAHLQVRRNDEVEAQSRSERDRWTFYETISLGSSESLRPLRAQRLDFVMKADLRF